jgi:uncharacterized protein YkwD
VTISVSRSRRRVALALLLVAVFFTSGIVTDPSRADAAPRWRAEMRQLTNEDRADEDRKALELDLQLSRYAKRHSRAMAEDGALSHTENLAAKLKGVEWTMGGENIGVGSSLSDIEAAFMASKLHRRNILRRQFDHVAIGVVQSGGNLWVTVIFYG